MLQAILDFVNTPLGNGLLFSALVFWPLWRMLVRAGFKPWPAVLVFVPVIGAVLVLGLLALRKWPVLAREE